MVKKEIQTKEVEIVICDLCGNEKSDDWTDHYYKCPFCQRDMCIRRACSTDIGVTIDMWAGEELNKWNLSYRGDADQTIMSRVCTDCAKKYSGLEVKMIQIQPVPVEHK